MKLPNAITIFTRERCPYCKAALDFLRVRNIPFTEVSHLDASYAVQSEKFKYVLKPLIVVSFDDGTERHISGFRHLSTMRVEASTWQRDIALSLL